MQTWLFVGSSQNAPRQIRKARLWSTHETITSNSGIFLEPSCGYYFISWQGPGSERFIQAAIISQQFGTKIVGWQSQAGFMAEKLDGNHLDEIIDNGKDTQLLSPHDYSPLHYSGQICMHFACSHGAKRLIVVGCEGYAKRGEIYFDEELRIAEEVHRFRNAKGDRVNDDVIVPETTLVCRCWPDVEFICIGQPRYHIDEPNWSVIDA